jgi:hypothetical protein
MKRKRKKEKAWDGMQCNGMSSPYKQLKLEKKKNKTSVIFRPMQPISFLVYLAIQPISFLAYLAHPTQIPFLATLIHHPPRKAYFPQPLHRPCQHKLSFLPLLPHADLMESSWVSGSGR